MISERQETKKALDDESQLLALKLPVTITKYLRQIRKEEHLLQLRGFRSLLAAPTVSGEGYV